MNAKKIKQIIWIVLLLGIAIGLILGFIPEAEVPYAQGLLGGLVLGWAMS